LPADRDRRFVPVEVDGIDAVQVGGLPGNLGLVSRWEVTCGVCRARFRRMQVELLWGSRLSWVGCPECGAHNLLPHHPTIRGRRG
jgi:DNA polymerase II large subunit